MVDFMRFTSPASVAVTSSTDTLSPSPPPARRSANTSAVASVCRSADRSTVGRGALPVPAVPAVLAAGGGGVGDAAAAVVAPGPLRASAATGPPLPPPR